MRLENEDKRDRLGFPERCAGGGTAANVPEVRGDHKRRRKDSKGAPRARGGARGGVVAKGPKSPAWRGRKAFVFREGFGRLLR